ncbi:type II toxin-antitoxin system RelE/ParE family toxin [Methylobacterium sp. 174MFSha1.1]|uniref:type II toxin-antitoxin system RelE/ParE family toxin n=1 Tax=Methylobacterium sp. 174MFSha1.1 TaxID=1502749 RepID=UPI000B888AF9|nr:type II toxin-antitoxin system RelE/ParE family toxin [Methylobacterium sp. 174MFSha1.1]
MAAKLSWSRRAREALLDIYLTIGVHNQTAAERIYDRIEQHAEKLRDHPRMGPRRSDIRSAARVLVEPPYIILYEIVPDTDDGPIDIIEIVTVLDGRRDLSLGI